MNTETLEKGTKVYNVGGEAAEVVMPNPDGSGYLVRPLLEFIDDEIGPYTELGDITLWAKVYPSPPVEKYHDEIVKLQEKQDALRKEISELGKTRNEILRTETEDKKRMAKLAIRSRALTRIEDFLDGKITHYVKANKWKRGKDGSQYSGVYDIVEVASELCGDGYRGNPKKLLTLFGKEPGNLEFGLNRYSDGSGASDAEVWPCCSKEEAMEQASELTLKQLKDWREAETRLKPNPQAVRDNHLLYRGDVPVDVLDAIRAESIALVQSVVKVHQTALDKAQKALAAAESA